MRKPQYDVLMKMIFIGESGVGKTKLLDRVESDEYKQRQYVTLCMEFKSRIFNTEDLKVKVLFWDTAGQERYRAVSPVFYKGAEVVILCYSLNDEASIHKLKGWLSEINKYTSQDTLIYLVGCKSDLQNKISFDILDQMAQLKGLKQYLTSAKTGQGVQEAFRSIVSEWARKKVQQLNSSGEKNQIIQINSNKQSLKDGQNINTRTYCC